MVQTDRLQRSVSPEDDAFEGAEVPATVVCARCGKPDCPGCLQSDETTLPSGVVPIIPWERPIGSSWSRLWATARAATRQPSSFFGMIPKGEIAAPLRFAFLCELLAIGSVAGALLLVATILAPGAAYSAVVDPHWRSLVGRLVLLGIPSFSLLLVVTHVAWGWALDGGARRAGARAHTVQALRFGLYGTGLDLFTSPAGVVYALIVEGPGATFGLLRAAVEVPSAACTAVLVRIYHLDERQVRAARRFASVVISIAAIVGVLLVMIGLALAVLA